MSDGPTQTPESRIVIFDQRNNNEILFHFFGKHLLPLDPFLFVMLSSDLFFFVMLSLVYYIHICSHFFRFFRFGVMLPLNIHLSLSL